MNFPTFFLESNPFFDAYAESDILGKAIFIGLIALSIVSWTVVIYKVWMTTRVKKASHLFRKDFLETRDKPLSIEPKLQGQSDCPNAFAILYEVIKTKAQEIFRINCKNDAACLEKPYLLPDDVSLLSDHANSTISSLTKYLEKNLYLLSTVVTLAPFLGLLGTVYGILTTFTALNSAPMGGSQVILGGLSLALTTTVIGLVDAIPALIGYNYLKNVISEFDNDMDRFATDVLSSLELNYRKRDIV